MQSEQPKISSGLHLPRHEMRERKGGRKNVIIIIVGQKKRTMQMFSEHDDGGLFTQRPSAVEPGPLPSVSQPCHGVLRLSQRFEMASQRLWFG